MKKKYVYNNATIHILMTDKTTNHIRKATEKFLKKVMLEKEKK